MREESRDTGISEESPDEIFPRETANALLVTIYCGGSEVV
jgi:hypothetical protein